MVTAKQKAAFVKQTKDAIAAYTIVYRDLSQDIGYTRKGERHRKHALQMLSSRLWELENVWLDITDGKEVK